MMEEKIAAANSAELDADLNHHSAPTRRERLGLPALALATVVSSAGNNLSAIALPWFVLVTTGSAARTGIVAAAGLLPVAVAGVIGGAFVDRLGFKRASVLADVLSGLTIAAVPTLHILGVLQFWHLLALVFLGAVFDVPGNAARDALLPTLARRVGTPLERANATFQIALFSASVAGPLLAGVLIATFSATSVLYLDAITFAFSALLIAIVITAPPEARGARLNGERGSTWSEVREGLRFLARQRLLLTMAALSVSANFFFAPLFAVIFPVLAKREFNDPQALGLLVASFGIGSVVGSVIYAAVGPRIRRMPIFIACIVGGSVGLWLFPFSTSLALSVATGAAVGLSLGPINVLAMTVMQERVPSAMLGRMNGALAAASQLAAPLGVLLAGVFIELIGVRGELALVAAGFTAVVLIALLTPVLRTMDDEPSPLD